MCQIEFTIATTSEYSTVVSAEGRYKLTSENESVSTWVSPFFIEDVSESITPDITIEGDYEFNIRVLDDDGVYSNWFLVQGGFKIGNCVPDEPNEAPTVIVTSDSYSMSLPTNQTNLQAAASDADGYIVSYLWTKVSGGDVNIVSPTSINTDITGMVEGSYIFRCTVTDNDGLTASDQKDINVLAQQEVYPTISSSLPNASGEGTLDFSNGTPNEVVDLLFQFTIGNQGNPGGAVGIDFSSPVQVAPLDSIHLSRPGTVTLDSGGNASSNYEMEGQNLVCTVTITGNNDSTQFYN